MSILPFQLSKLSSAFFLILISNISYAQQIISPFEYHDLMPVDSLKMHEINKTLRAARIARNYTFAGEYSKSDSLAPAVYPSRFDSLTSSDLNILEKYSKADAIQTIDSLSKLYNVILINENHSYPFHRIFVHNIIDDLSKNGYSLFGLEALTINYKHISGKDSTVFNLNDTLLNSRGYPIYSGFTGTYTKEPQMGNLIRRSLEYGYDLFGYDKLKGDRELNQAKTITSFRKKFPNRKILILCGFMHLAEEAIPGINVKLMGQYLKEEIKEDILTIEQTRLSYHPIHNSKLYTTINPQNSVVLEGEDGSFFSTFSDSLDKPYDLSIFHPKFDNHNGRPEWLNTREGAKEVYFNDKIKIKTPFTIVARKKDELMSTPVDILYITSLQEMKPLYLETGEYVLELTNLYKQSQKVSIKVE